MSGYNFTKNIEIFCLKIFFTLNSVDPDEMAHACGISSGSSLFAKVPVQGFPVYKGLI